VTSLGLPGPTRYDDRFLITKHSFSSLNPFFPPTLSHQTAYWSPMSKEFEEPIPEDDCNTCDLLKSALNDSPQSHSPSGSPFGGPHRPAQNPAKKNSSLSQRILAASNRTPMPASAAEPDSSDFWAMEPPPGLVEIGNAGWTTLHTMAAYYPDRPSEEAKQSAVGLMRAFTQIFPCGDCARDLSHWMDSNPPKVDSQQVFSQWMCDTHNHVNRQLGKPEFDCSLVNQRWSRLPHHRQAKPK